MIYIVIGIAVLALIIIIITKKKDNKALERKDKDLNEFLDRSHKTEMELNASLAEKNRIEKGLQEQVNNLQKQLDVRLGLLEVAGSNLSAIPYMSAIIADYETYGIEQLAACLDWGSPMQK